jgi:meiotically up-regulated gene 157 (Mug157) protein
MIQTNEIKKVFENKPEIEIDGQPYIYFDYATFINAGSSDEITAIHLECISKMIEVYNKQQERQVEVEKKSVLGGKSTKAES